MLTRAHITAIVTVSCFIAVGTAFAIWEKITPNMTPEQRRNDAYYSCVRIKVINALPVEDCLNIK